MCKTHASKATNSFSKKLIDAGGSNKTMTEGNKLTSCSGQTSHTLQRRHRIWYS